MGHYGLYREAELEALGVAPLRTPEIRRLVDRAVHSSVSGVVITDATLPDNPIVFVNPAFERITGYPSEEVLGHNCRFLQGELGRDQPAVEELREAIREGSECRVVLKNYRKDGTPFWNELSVSPVRDEEGRLTNHVGVQNDITERREIEEERSRLANELRLLLQSTGEGIFGVDSGGRLTFVNRSAARMLGYEPDEVLDEDVHSLIHHSYPDGSPYPEEECPIQRSFLTGRECRVEDEVFWRKDGSPFPVAYSSHPMTEGEEVRGAVVAFEDVTERKRAETALKESEDQLRLAIESTGLGTWDFDLVGDVLKWDDRCKAVFGLPPEAEVDYETFLKGLHPEDRERTDQVVKWALDPESRGAYDIEYRTVGLADGVERWVAARGQVLFDERGRAVRFIGTVLDITERKRAEETQRFLADASATLSSSLDYRTTLTGVARLAVPRLADWCVVDVLEEDGSLERLAVAHRDPEMVALAHELQERYPPDPDAQHGAAQVLRTGQPEFAPEIPEAVLEARGIDPEYREVLKTLGLKSYLVVPLVARGRALGVITLVFAESGRRYGEADLGPAEELARRAALAVDNARLYRERGEIARTLQEGLLPPSLPEVPGVEVGLCYLPAGRVDVGGDLYDLFDVGAGRDAGGSEPSSSSWGVVIGDVCGKGAEAAAVLALARYTIRAVAMRDPRPSTVLAGLNEAMLRQRRERGDHKFCTIAYAKLETVEGSSVRATVSRGGHPSPVLLEAGGRAVAVGHPGRALGVFDDPRLTEQEIRLKPGDALVLYTDGVIEARSPDDGAFYGEERFLNLLRACAGRSAREISARIEREILEFQGHELQDDVAVLVLRAL